MVNNATFMASYSSCKLLILNFFAFEGMLLQLILSLCAAFIVTLTVSPLEKCCNLLMSSKTLCHRYYVDPLKYERLTDCLLHIWKNEGPLGLYKGWGPAWSKNAPNTIIYMLIFENLKRLPIMAMA